MWDQQLQSALCCGLGLKDARHGSLAGNRLGYLSAFAWAKSIGSPLAGYSSKPLRCNHFPPSFFSLSPLRTPSVPLFTLLCLLFNVSQNFCLYFFLCVCFPKLIWYFSNSLLSILATTSECNGVHLFRLRFICEACFCYGRLPGKLIGLQSERATRQSSPVPPPRQA